MRQHQSGQVSTTKKSGKVVEELGSPKSRRPKKSGAIVIIDKSELQRIKDNCAPPVKVNDAEESKKAAMEAAMERSARMMEKDARRAKTEVSDLEQEDAQHSEQILERAKRIIEERNDEIKKMNEFIEEAKCMQVRTRQLEEKKLIQEATKEEEIRMDAMMEYHRQKLIETELKKADEQRAKVRESALVIMDQIETRREALILETERREVEAKLAKELIAKQLEDDVKKEQSKKLVKKDLLLQVLQANDDNIKRKKEDKVRSKEEDLKILEYMVAKAKKEEEKEKQEALRKAEKEKEYARLRALQEKMQDKRSEQDALRAKRASEQYEREWRRKEKEAATRKAKFEAELRESRLSQTKNREHLMAVEALKTRQEFFEMVKKQQEADEKLEREKQIKHEKRREYNVEINKQVSDRELERKKEHGNFLREGVALDRERADRKKNIEQIKQRKIAEIKAMGISEQQCNEILRRMRLLENPKLMA